MFKLVLVISVHMQGQALYTGMDTNKFYPLVYGGDIASIDADEGSAGYKTFLSTFELKFYMKLLANSREHTL